MTAVLPPELEERCAALVAAGYTGKMEIDWKDGRIRGWRFVIQEAPASSERGRSSFRLPAGFDRKGDVPL